MLITDADKGVLGADTFGLKSWAQYSSDFKEKQLRQQQANLEKKQCQLLSLIHYKLIGLVKTTSHE